jgi:signal transduction histidine kinase
MPASTLETPPPVSLIEAPAPTSAGLRWTLPLVSLAMVGLIVVLDAWAEPDLSLKLLYLLPVLLASWFGGASAGILISLAAAVAWFVADPSNRRMHVVLAVENAVTRFVLFGIVAALFARVRRAVDLERERVRRVHDFNRVLEARVKERTSDLEAALADLKGFAYAIAHELRSPLRAMHGFSDILLEDRASKAGADERRYLEAIRRAARRMDLQVLALLEYATLLHGRFEVGPVDLSACLEEVVEEFDRRHFVLEGPFPAVRGHREPLTRALRQLLSNAVKFSALGKPPRVRVRAEERGDVLRLWVEDQGIGIDPLYAEIIFQPFQRLDLNHPGEGTGMGLAIVRKALERMGGRAGVESEPGRGSRFWIELSR